MVAYLTQTTLLWVCTEFLMQVYGLSYNWTPQYRGVQSCILARTNLSPAVVELPAAILDLLAKLQCAELIVTIALNSPAAGRRGRKA